MMSSTPLRRGPVPATRTPPRLAPFAWLALAATLLSACAPKEADDAPAADARPAGHLFTDQASGVGLDLPALWASRYRVGDSVAVPVDGLERELAFRYVKADSSLVPEPMIVVRVFRTAAWKALPPDSAAARYGTLVAQNDVHTVALRPAAANPLAPGSADALGYDSLMMVVLQRPLRASLRPATP